MPEIRILHTADLHLDWPFAGFGMDAARGRSRREESRRTFAGIIEIIRQHEPHLLLISGDLFEQKYVSKETVAFVNDQFRTIPSTHVFILPGRHDPLVANSFYRTFDWAPNVHIFGSSWERVDLDGWGVSVYGAAITSPAEVQEEFLASRCPLEDPERLNIVMLYGAASARELARLGADYVALGGQHQQSVVLERDGRIYAQYPGSPEALDWADQGARAVVAGTLGKKGARFQLLPSPTREVVVKEVDVTGASSLDDVLDFLIAADAPLNRRQHLYQITLTGLVDPDLEIDPVAATDRIGSEFYYVRLIDRTYPDYDYERLSAEKTARGQFVRRLLDMERAATDLPTKDRVRRALSAGLRALAGKGAGA